MQQFDETIMQMKRLMREDSNDGFAKPATRKQMLAFIRTVSEGRRACEELERIREERDALLATVMLAMGEGEETMP
jgi:hypothetical protein